MSATSASTIPAPALTLGGPQRLVFRFFARNGNDTITLPGGVDHLHTETSTLSNRPNYAIGKQSLGGAESVVEVSATMGSSANNRGGATIAIAPASTSGGDDPPESPPSLSLQAQTSTRVRASWSLLGDATSYQARIRQLPSGSFGDWENTGDVAAWTFNDLEPDSDYEVEVRGVNSHGEGPASTDSTTTLATSPAVDVTFSAVGGVTPQAAVVAGELEDEATVRLVVSTDSSLTSPIFGDPFTTERHEGAGDPPRQSFRASVSGLAAGVSYHWGLESNGTLLTEPRGTFTSAPQPGLPSSFLVALGGDNSSGSNAVTFDRIRARQPAFFMHMGDLHYTDVSVNDYKVVRDHYQAAHTARFKQLVNEVPFVYMYDNHDGGSTFPVAWPAVLEAYRRYMPYHPLVNDLPLDAEGTYHEFMWGRVHFLNLDYRSERITAGSGKHVTDDQMQWIKDTMLASGAELFVLNVGVAWNATSGSSHWNGASAQRQELCEFWESNELTRRVLLVHADTHWLAMDDGTNSQFASGSSNPGPYVFCAAPLDRFVSSDDGVYSHGTEDGSQQQYGTVGVVDLGDRIEVTCLGYDANDDTVKLSMEFEVDAELPAPGNVQVVVNSRTSATVTWDDVAEADVFQVEARVRAGTVDP